ncbi:MAG: membrane protein insertion efficiency factor YidD [Endomicrobium sp.]|nr:membrane protein insertion efficiency factor YidD [Endomicrobium sp.]
MVIINRINNIVLYIIKLYIMISSIFAFQHRCRFYPTCSVYAYKAITVHGFLKGGSLTIYRLLRCHPLCKGGIEYVPCPSDKLRKIK